jgi:hypothetical protein
MEKTSDFLADEDLPKARVALLLKHFSRLDDDREPWRVVYPLSEVLLLLTCATLRFCNRIMQQKSPILSTSRPSRGFTN